MPQKQFAYDAGTSTWLNYDPLGDDVPVILLPEIDLGPVIHTQAEIDAWATGTDQYNDLSGQSFMSLSRTIVDMGTAISTIANRNIVKDNAVYAVGQARLWAADGNASRLAKVIEVLDSVKDVTVFNSEAGQDNLVSGWLAPNLCAAAEIIGYYDTNFQLFLRNVLYPLLDWTTGGNWFMSFWDGRTAIASYLRDTSLWADAMAYGDFHIPQTIYHDTYDAGLVVPCRSGNWPAKATGSVNLTRSVNHWGGTFGTSYRQIDTTLVAKYSAGVPSDPTGTLFPNGTDCERLRDLSHICFTLAGAMHACRTILAVGDTVPQHALDRTLAAYSYHATRVLSYINSGHTTIPAPAPVGGDGGTGYRSSWWGGKKLFELASVAVPADLTSLLAKTEIIDYDPSGDLHMTSERFADPA